MTGMTELQKLAYRAEHYYRIDPLFHAQVRAGATVLMALDDTEFEDQYGRELAWRKAKHNAASMLVAMNDTYRKGTVRT